ncbi:MAG: hypothetical protein RLP09_07490 [Sandaracinaceae bacterium]
MRTTTSGLAALAIVLIGGCAAAHDRDEAGAGAPDASAVEPDADAAGACPGLAGYETCRELCGGRRRCPGERGLCSHDLLVCLPADLPACTFLGEERADEYCANGEMCVVERWLVGRERGWFGRCAGERYCRESGAFGIDVACVYSDGSEMAEGPPDEGACPSAGGAELCGGSCGGCPMRARPETWLSDWRLSCLGVSEERGFGVCTFGGSSPCSRDGTSYATWCDRMEGQPCACVVPLDDEGVPEAEGRVGLAESCLTYRARYPDAVECFHPTEWTRLE